MQLHQLKRLRIALHCVLPVTRRRTSRTAITRMTNKKMERETRLELATPTLARLCSTTELFPHLKNVPRATTGGERCKRKASTSPALRELASPRGFEPLLPP